MPRPKKQHLKRRKDGRYVCKWHGMSFYAYSEDEALRARADYQKEASRPIQRRYMTLMEYAVYWLPIHKASVKASTYNAYVSVLNTVLKPISNVYLSQVTTDDVSEAYSKLTGKSASYIHKAKILLTEMLDSAYDAGYLERNPARAMSVKPPKGSSGTHRAITQEERELIHKVKHRMQNAAMIMLYAGLRRGEVLALDYSDIGDYINVCKSVYYVSNQPVLSTTKTEAGKRLVPVISVLRHFLGDSSGLVLKGSNDTYMTEQAWQRAWESYQKELSKAAGHEIKIRPHDLRHSYCTMLRDAGIDMHQAMIWMGHADEKLILKIYDHVGEERTQKSVEQLEKSLIGSQFGSQLTN